MIEFKTKNIVRVQKNLKSNNFHNFFEKIKIEL
jgi:hypothetical protein